MQVGVRDVRNSNEGARGEPPLLRMQLVKTSMGEGDGDHQHARSQEGLLGTGRARGGTRGGMASPRGSAGAQSVAQMVGVCGVGYMEVVVRGDSQRGNGGGPPPGCGRVCPAGAAHGSTVLAVRGEGSRGGGQRARRAGDVAATGTAAGSGTGGAPREETRKAGEGGRRSASAYIERRG